MQRAISTLKTFKNKIEQYNISNINATATSAMRNARNGFELTDNIKKETGISVRIISGLEEADYIYLGVTKTLRDVNVT